MLPTWSTSDRIAIGYYITSLRRDNDNDMIWPRSDWLKENLFEKWKYAARKQANLKQQVCSQLKLRGCIAVENKLLRFCFCISIFAILFLHFFASYFCNSYFASHSCMGCCWIIWQQIAHFCFVSWQLFSAQLYDISMRVPLLGQVVRAYKDCASHRASFCGIFMAKTFLVTLFCPLDRWQKAWPDL